MLDHSIPSTTEDTTEEIPRGFCLCGCGQKTNIAKHTNRRLGQVRGEPFRYCLGHHTVRRPKVVKLEGLIASIEIGGGHIALIALIDLADLGKVRQFTWHIRGHHRRRYAYTNIPGQGATSMHRLVMDAPPGLEVDHKNGDGLDNRRSNLRPATHSQNMANRPGDRGTSSRFKGVSLYRCRGNWMAYISIRGRRKTIGYFSTEIEAALIYDEWARKDHGEFACVNFPRPGERSALTGAIEPNGKVRDAA